MIVDITQWPINPIPPQGQNKNNHGWPCQLNNPPAQASWFDPYWHDDIPYNQYCNVTENYPDGTRIYYDPVKGVHSFEYWNGSHEAWLPDGYVSHVVNHRSTFTGGSHSEAISGHYDSTIRGHSRTNVTGDTYQHTEGVHHQFALGGMISFTPGDVTHEVGGTMQIRLSNDGSAFVIGQAGGAGQLHDNVFSLTKGQLWLSGNKAANVGIISAQGKMVGMEATTGNLKINAKQGQTTHNGQNIDINGSSKVQINGGGTSGGGMPCPAIKTVALEVTGGATFDQGFQVASGHGATFMGGSTGGDTSGLKPGDSGGSAIV